MKKFILAILIFCSVPVFSQQIGAYGFKGGVTAKILNDSLLVIRIEIDSVNSRIDTLIVSTSADSAAIYDSLLAHVGRIRILEAPEQSLSNYWVTEETAGEAITAPAVAFIDSMDGKVYLFTTDSTRQCTFGPVMAITSGALDETITVVHRGYVGGLSGLAKGTKVWADTTAGNYTCTPDSNAAFQGLGRAISTTEMEFAPDVVWAIKDTSITSSIVALVDSIDNHDSQIKVLRDTTEAHNDRLHALGDSLVTGWIRADSIDVRTATIDSMTINYVLHIDNVTVIDTAIAIATGMGTDTTFIDPAAGYALRHSDNGATVASIDTNGNVYGTTYGSDGSISDAELKDIDNFTGTGDYVKAGSPALTGTPELAAPTATTNAVGTAQTIGMTLRNTTAAAAGAQQYSPMYVMKGFGWKTDATAGSQAVEYGYQVRSIQGASAPTAALDLFYRVNGGTWTFLETVLSNGYRGIGMTSPLAKLDINNASGYYDSTYPWLSLGYDGQQRFRGYMTSNNQVVLEAVNGTTDLLLNPTAGNVGIGTSSWYGSTAKLLTWGGNIASWNVSTLGSATLTNPNLTSGTSWTATNDAALTGDECRWIYSAGTASTLTQTSATFAIPVQPNRMYVFTYVVSDVAGTPSASITTGVATESTSLTLTNGAQTTYFMTNSSPGNFVITATLTTGQRFDLDTFVLKEAQGGNVIAGGKFTGGGTLGLKINGSGVATFDAAVNVATGAKTSTGSVQWTASASDYIDGAAIANGTIKTAKCDTVGTDGLATQEDITNMINIGDIGKVKANVVLDTDPTIILTAQDCMNGIRINNDADVIDYTLPACATGLCVMFADMAGGAITVDTYDGTDTINLYFTALTAGNAIVSPGVLGNYITLFGLDDSRWIAIGGDGGWTDKGAD